MAFAVAADVQKRIPYRVLDAINAPTITTVDEWLDEASAEIQAALLNGHVDTDSADARGLKLLKKWTIDYGEARVRRAFAASGGSGSNEDGDTVLEEYVNRIADILKNPDRYGAMILGGAGSAPDKSRKLRSHVTDNPNNGDTTNIQPTFTRDEVF